MLTASVMLEAAWELLENSPIIINRYRSVTIAMDYVGDSVMNSLSDVAWCTLGVILASRLKPSAVLGLFLFFELTTLAIVRDNLSLNVLMLIYPLDSVASWQLELAPTFSH